MLSCPGPLLFFNFLIAAKKFRLKLAGLVPRLFHAYIRDRIPHLKAMVIVRTV